MLKLFLGNMMAGKTSHLLADLITLHDLGKNVLYINHIKDTRDAEFSTHKSAKYQLPKGINRVKIDQLAQINPEGYFAIGIDEAQWYPDLVPIVKKWLSLGIYVICVGLNGDFKQEPFGDILKLVPLAEEIIHLKAKCLQCLEGLGILNDAPFTKKLTGDPTVDQPGGSELYAAVCRKHL